MRSLVTALTAVLLSGCAPSAQTPLQSNIGVAELTVLAEAGDDLTDAVEATKLDATDVAIGASRVAVHVKPAHGDAHALGDDALVARLDDDPASLGPLSMGRPNAGALINGMQFPEGERWDLISPQRAWATSETIEQLITAIDAVHDNYPEDTHKLFIGHLSREHGGPIRPHRSHQSGRDVDCSYYYLPHKAEWYRPAVKGTLDLDRTWAFVRAMITETDVEMILIDIRVQKLLKQHAVTLGEDKEWLDSVFQFRGRGGAPIIRHAYGHRTHIHVRFFNPKAQSIGRRLHGELTKRKKIAYTVRPGDTIISLSAKTGASPRALMHMNRMRRAKVTPGQRMILPMRGRIAQVRPIDVPPRRLPPVGTRVGAITAAAK